MKLSTKKKLIYTVIIWTAGGATMFAQLSEVALWQVIVFGVLCALTGGMLAYYAWPTDQRYGIWDSGLVRARASDELPMSYHDQQEAEFAMNALIARGILPITAEVVEL